MKCAIKANIQNFLNAKITKKHYAKLFQIVDLVFQFQIKIVLNQSRKKLNYKKPEVRNNFL